MYMRARVWTAMVTFATKASFMTNINVSVFIYSMPGYSISIKERMLYSSCKKAVVDVIEKVYSIPVAKKIEVDSGSELTEAFLQVHASMST